MARRRMTRCVASLLIGLVLVLITSVYEGGGGTLPVAAAAGTQPILAADYFGIANPINFWSSDISGAKASFRLMREDGFNAVALVLPWGDFEPGIDPVRFNPDAFSRLDFLIRTAAALHMGVVLRLSYEFDIYPADQMPTVERIEAAYGGGPAYRAWLDYISKVHQNVARFSNVRAAYISWEDFSYPIQSATSISGAPAVKLASTIGFQSWLKTTEPLSSVDTMYGTHFSSWSTVPTPTITSPSFRLMYEFQDWSLVHHFFLPAQQRFPGLTMETRVDVDPIYNGSQVVSSYEHTAQYQLPNTSVTGMYFSPYMGDPSSSLDETAPEALAALRSTLVRMSSAAGRRKLFIYEYEIVSNSPAVSNDPNLTPDQVGPFILQSEPLLAKYTDGYALWTYRDFNLSGVYNPSFSVGSAGWTLLGPAKVVDPRAGMSYLALGTGASAKQVVNPGNVALTPGAPLTLSLEASPASAGSLLRLAVGSAAPQTVVLGEGWSSYSIQVPQSDLGTGTITITDTGPTKISNVQLYTFTQTGDVYSNTGVPEVAVGPLTTLNHQLQSKGAASS